MPYVDKTTEEVKTACVRIGNTSVMVAVEPDHASGENTLYAYAYDSYIDDYADDQVTISGYPIDFNKYELLKGVKCTGTQYCVTDTKSDETYKFILHFKITVNTTQYVFGSNISAKYALLYRTTSALTAKLGSQSKNASDGTIPINTDTTVVLDENGVNVNGTLTAWNSPIAAYTATKHIGIGAALNSSDLPTNSYYFKGIMYSVEVFDTANNTDVAYYVPAKRRADGVVGFYDLVSGKFYDSDGADPFQEA